jgi:hypothetical protein
MVCVHVLDRAHGVHIDTDTVVNIHILYSMILNTASVYLLHRYCGRYTYSILNTHAFRQQAVNRAYM